MTDTLPPLTPSELSDLKAKAKAAPIYSTAAEWAVLYDNILRLIDMVERHDTLAVAAREVVEDALLAGSIDSRFSLSNVPANSTTAKLIRLREALASTEPQT